MYKIDSTISNIDKLMELMKKCAKEKVFVGEKGLLNLSDFRGYSMIFFREINRLPECFYGEQDGLLDLDLIAGLSMSSRYDFAKAIISRSPHAKAYVKSYLEQYEGIVEKIHKLYQIIGQNSSSQDAFTEEL